MRKFLTKSLIDKHADAGVLYIEIDKVAVVTSEAWDQARKRGVEIKRVEQVDYSSEHTACAPEEHQKLRLAVRAAVIGKLGLEPAQVDQAIDAVLARLKL